MDTTNDQKLVRDNIPLIIERTGASVVTRRLSDGEYREALNQKLQEEVNEYLENENAEELADVVEVIHAILALKGISVEALEALRRQKRERNGGFETRCFLESVTADPYAGNPRV